MSVGIECIKNTIHVTVQQVCQTAHSRGSGAEQVKNSRFNTCTRLAATTAMDHSSTQHGTHSPTTRMTPCPGALLGREGSGRDTWPAPARSRTRFEGPMAGASRTPRAVGPGGSPVAGQQGAGRGEQGEGHLRAGKRYALCGRPWQSGVKSWPPHATAIACPVGAVMPEEVLLRPDGVGNRQVAAKTHLA